MNLTAQESSAASKIEERLHEFIGATEQTFVVAGVPDEKKGEKLVVLHWSIEGFRRMLLDNEELSERILSRSLRILHEGDQALIDSLSSTRGSQPPPRGTP